MGDSCRASEKLQSAVMTRWWQAHDVEVSWRKCNIGEGARTFDLMIRLYVAALNRKDDQAVAWTYTGFRRLRSNRTRIARQAEIPRLRGLRSG